MRVNKAFTQLNTNLQMTQIYEWNIFFHSIKMLASFQIGLGASTLAKNMCQELLTVMHILLTCMQ